MVFSISPSPNTHTHTAVFVVEPTRLWCVDGHFVGIRPNSMLALGSQLEGVGGEGLQVLQQVGGGGLKAHFLLKGHKENGGTVEYAGCEKNKRKKVVTISTGCSKRASFIELTFNIMFAHPSIYSYIRPSCCYHPSNHPGFY